MPFKDAHAKVGRARIEQRVLVATSTTKKVLKFKFDRESKYFIIDVSNIKSKDKVRVEFDDVQKLADWIKECK